MFSILPPEIKVEIFDYLGPKQRQKIREVCLLWDDLISRVYGATIVFSNSKWLNSLPDFNGPLCAVFRSYSHPILDRMEGEDVVNRITKLTLGGNLIECKLIPLLEKCSNLKHLGFDKPKMNPVLETYNLNSNNASKFLPLLSSLKINFQSPRFRITWDFVRVLFKLFEFLATPTKLTTIDLHYTSWHNFELWPNQIFDIDWTPTNDQIYTVHNIFRNLFVTLVRSNLQTLSELHLYDTTYKRKNHFRFIPLAMMEPVSHFTSKVWISDVTETRECLTLHDSVNWLNIISPQRTLENLQISQNICPRAWSTITGILKNNASTVRKVLLTHFHHQTRNDPITETFNASEFSTLSSLEKMVFLSNNTNPGFGRNRYIGKGSELTNINNLPNSLRIFKLSLTMAFAKESEFCLKSLENLKNLQFFEFSAFPWFRFGDQEIIYMDGYKVRNLISWLRRLKKLTLRNRTIPDYKIPMSPNTIPNLSIDWIKSTAGLSLCKTIVSKNDDDDNRFFKGQRVKDTIIDIVIDSQFHQNDFTII